MWRTAGAAVTCVALVGGLLLLAACTGAGQPTAQQGPPPTPTSPPASPTPESAATVTIAPPAPTASPTAAASPTVAVSWPERLEIPSIQVEAPVVLVGLDPDGAMQAPNGPDVIGWYSGSVAPGLPGNTLITAHVDWLNRETGKAQEAVFWNLRKVKNGDRVIVRSEDGKAHTYAVRESIVFAFDDSEALTYMQPTTRPIMTLITCEGSFDPITRNYSQRRIVVADLQ